MCQEEKCIHMKLMEIIWEKGMRSIPKGTLPCEVCDTLGTIILNIAHETSDPEMFLKGFISSFQDQIEYFRSQI